ncbi:chemotaxis protein CheA [Candidatus Kuenenbacteria bacterium]|nr:chemotaxis protein CheA [Candidatus Kuenenbacteria bacterium]
MNDKYKKLFISEAEEKIAALNTAFLGLEKKPGNSALVNDAMRAAHTLKSSSAAMNFMEMSHLCHAMENVLEEARAKKQTLTPQNIEVLFQSVDMLSISLDNIKKNKNEMDTKELIEKLHSAQNDAGPNAEKRGKIPCQSASDSASVRVGALAPIESIKVDIDTLDKLMNLTEELLVERMRLSEIVRIGKEKLDKKLDVAECEGSSEAFNRLISELQLNVTQARMVPLEQIFERFPRMVRDLAHSQEKQIDFQITGQNIELDRTVIDRIGEPLIHLLRNAIDHGIEKVGNIKLNAMRERDKVIIEVINEGKSIDWQKVIETAFARGIIDKITREKYLKNIGNWELEIGNLLYRVSTKDKVTEISGRGVGLIIVKSVIESLGGRVQIESNNNETKFILSLPLTLAIIQALLVRVTDQTFAIPFVQIDRSVRISKQNIKKAFDQEIAVVEDEDIPMIRLDKLFGIAKKRAGLFLSEEEVLLKISQTQAELMVITKREQSATSQNFGNSNAGIGLIVDELLSKQDIVVKPLKGMIKKTKGFAGITLLGDGKPAMILDVTTLLNNL